jgi:hypothetical protein
MGTKNVYVLVHSNPDYVNVEVYEKEEDAIQALEELANEYDMEVDGSEAFGDEDHAIVEEKEVI